MKLSVRLVQSFKREAAAAIGWEQLFSWQLTSRLPSVDALLAKSRVDAFANISASLGEYVTMLAWQPTWLTYATWRSNSSMLQRTITGISGASLFKNDKKGTVSCPVTANLTTSSLSSDEERLAASISLFASSSDDTTWTMWPAVVTLLLIDCWRADVLQSLWATSHTSRVDLRRNEMM